MCQLALGAGVLVLWIEAAKMFLAESFVVVARYAQRDAVGFLDGVPARVVVAARDRYFGRWLALYLRQERRQRIQGRAGRR